MMLHVQNIDVYYGVYQALFGVSLKVKKGEIVCIVGRNASGKTTLLRSIMGMVHVKRGAIIFRGENITNEAPYKIAEKGIAYIPPVGEEVFNELTVRENLLLGGIKSRCRDINVALTYFPALKGLLDRRAHTLSGGERRMLSIARALMGKNELLLLDEPSEGLAPIMVMAVRDVLRKVNEEGVTLLLAEQNTKLAMELADRIYVMQDGEVKDEGTVEEVRTSLKKYLFV